MNSSKKLLLFLLFVPGILAEILSGNTPVIKLFSLGDLFFLVLAYGLPILLIREFRVWYKVSYFGLFLLGIVYGIFNEGFIAKTILDTSPVPLGGFQNFGLFAGLNISWGLMIIPWHAFFSVIFPIVFADYLFPGTKTVSLISKKTTTFFLLILYVGLVLLSKNWQGNISSILLSVFYVVSFFLIFLSKQFREIPRIDISVPRKSYLLGCMSIGIYTFFFSLASVISFWMYVGIGIVLWILLVGYFLRLSEAQIVRFGVGSYLTFGGFATLASIGDSRIDLLIVYPIFLLIMHYVLIYKNRFS
ncbi:hypothetical protein K2X92_01165 [Candidatus Gracilibacteria bacterium]|nr:hypothetical protein [Candidatus Gracilibacteria bacterium]